MSAVAELAADADVVAGLGHNRPPEATPWDGARVHMDDLLIEARNWADGIEVETQAQADEIGRLIEDLRNAGRAADAVRAEEKAPFDAKIEEIQTRYNAYIAGLLTKNSKPGSITRAVDALKATLEPYLLKLKAKQEAEAKRKREEAEEAAKIAREAAQAALTSDLAAQEDAEVLVEAAAAADAAAKRAENAKPQSRGGDRAIGLRTIWRAVMIDRKAALIHYAATQPEALTAFLQGLADADVRASKRQVPGFNVISESAL